MLIPKTLGVRIVRSTATFIQMDSGERVYYQTPLDEFVLATDMERIMRLFLSLYDPDAPAPDIRIEATGRVDQAQLNRRVRQGAKRYAPALAAMSDEDLAANIWASPRAWLKENKVHRRMRRTPLATWIALFEQLANRLPPEGAVAYHEAPSRAFTEWVDNFTSCLPEIKRRVRAKVRKAGHYKVPDTDEPLRDRLEHALLASPVCALLTPLMYTLVHPDVVAGAIWQAPRTALHTKEALSFMRNDLSFGARLARIEASESSRLRGGHEKEATQGSPFNFA